MLSLSTSVVGLQLSLPVRQAGPPRMQRAVRMDEAFGASHTSFYTDAVKKDRYDMCAPSHRPHRVA